MKNLCMYTMAVAVQIWFLQIKREGIDIPIETLTITVHKPVPHLHGELHGELPPIGRRGGGKWVLINDHLL